jgi:DNA topoisomerase IB
VLELSKQLPAWRAHIAEDLKSTGLKRDWVLALALHLLDRGYFRAGGEQYAEENDTYGIATLLCEHVTLRSDVVAFDYPAKSGVRRTLEVDETTGGACQLGRPEARSSRSNTRPSLSTNSRAAASTTQRVLTTTAASRTGHHGQATAAERAVSASG